MILKKKVITINRERWKYFVEGASILNLTYTLYVPLIDVISSLRLFFVCIFFKKTQFDTCFENLKIRKKICDTKKHLLWNISNQNSGEKKFHHSYSLGFYSEYVIYVNIFITWVDTIRRNMVYMGIHLLYDMEILYTH